MRTFSLHFVDGSQMTAHAVEELEEDLERTMDLALRDRTLVRVRPGPNGLANFPASVNPAHVMRVQEVIP